MGVIKEKSIKALGAAIMEIENGKSSGLSQSLNSLKTLTESYLNTSDKKERSKLTAEFKARHLELAAFLKDNPDLVNAEVEKSLLLAAVGGEYMEEETTLLPNGRRRCKKTLKQVAPNVAAASKWLINKDSENWAEKPISDEETEDTDAIERQLYGEQKND